MLFISGRDDEIVPPCMMDELFSGCSSPSKEFVKLRGHHNSTWTTPGYFDKMNSFLQKLYSEEIIPTM